VVMPPGSNARHIKVDEKAGICITTSLLGGLTVTHLFSGTVLWRLPTSHVTYCFRCEYDNGYLIFDREGQPGRKSKEVWRLASNFAEGEVAADAPPGDEQMAVSAEFANIYRHYAPYGQFRPWSLLKLDEIVLSYRLAYPTLICASEEHTFLYDVRTGSLVQTINIHLRYISDVDVNERHAFVCELDVVHVFSRESGIEVLRIPAEAIVRCSQRVEDPSLVSGDWFITPLCVSPEADESPLPKFIAARVSRDGRDLVVFSQQHCVIFIRDFERICRGETTFAQAGLVLGIPAEAMCNDLGFEHGRACVATIQGFYMFTFCSDFSVKAAFVRPFNSLHRSRPMGCIQLTDHRMYFTWEDSRRRQDLPLFEDDAENAPAPVGPVFDLDFEHMTRIGLWSSRFGPFDNNAVGCIDFTLMPEGFASEI